MKIIIHHGADHIHVESKDKVDKADVIAQLKKAIEYLENCIPERFVSTTYVRSLFFEMAPPMSEERMAQCKEELRKYLCSGDQPSGNSGQLNS